MRLPASDQPHPRLALLGQVAQGEDLVQQPQRQRVGLVDQQHGPAGTLFASRHVLGQRQPQFALVHAAIGLPQFVKDGLEQGAAACPAVRR